MIGLRPVPRPTDLALLLCVLLTTLGGGCDVEEMLDTRHEPATIVHRPGQSLAESGELAVMSWNVKGSLASRDERHVQTLADAIRAVGPDVVLLQEVHRRTRASGGRDQFDDLASLLGMSGCFGESLAVGDGSYGNAILTSGEITTGAVHALPGRGEPRTVLECVSRWNQIEVPIFTTHLTAWDRANRRTRRAQVSHLERILDRTESPLIILGGDFNASLQAPELRPLTHHRKLAPVFSGYVVTHPGAGRSYDHLFVGDGWHVGESRVRRAGPSDHWAIIAEISWKEDR